MKKCALIWILLLYCIVSHLLVYIIFTGFILGFATSAYQDRSALFAIVSYFIFGQVPYRWSVVLSSLEDE